jgi:hypothetical protein
MAILTDSAHGANHNHYEASSDVLATLLHRNCSRVQSLGLSFGKDIRLRYNSVKDYIGDHFLLMYEVQHAQD